MVADKVRVGIVGIGFWSLTHHVPDLIKTGKAEIAALFRRSPTLRKCWA